MCHLARDCSKLAQHPFDPRQPSLQQLDASLERSSRRKWVSGGVAPGEGAHALGVLPQGSHVKGREARDLGFGQSPGHERELGAEQVGVAADGGADDRLTQPGEQGGTARHGNVPDPAGAQGPGAVVG